MAASATTHSSSSLSLPSSAVLLVPSSASEDVCSIDSDSDEQMTVDGKSVVVDEIVDDAVHEAPDLVVLDDSGEPHDFMEFYSPPRVVPKCLGLGLRAWYSFDVTSGHDFTKHCDRVVGFQLLREHKPTMIMLSPPCTMFSAIQRMWNIKKMSESQYQARMKEAICHIDYSMQLAMLQCHASRYFGFEQPGRASSWDLESVKRVAALPGVVKVAFDMCMFGKVTPFSKQPLKKRTMIMTTHVWLARSLEGHCCDGNHLHIRCMGAEQGITLSKWCQVYPPQLCDTIASSVASSTLRR